MARPLNIVSLDSSSTSKKDKKNNDALQGFDTKLPVMPKDLSDDAKKHWRLIGRKLAATGVISSVDLSVFRRYCETYALYLQAQKEVAEKGEYQSTPNEYEQLAPWAVARERHAAALQKMEAVLFLNPAARLKAKIPEPEQRGGSL